MSSLSPHNTYSAIPLIDGNSLRLKILIRPSVLPTANNPKDNKQLLDEVFVISRIIKVELGVISKSQKLRLITVTKTLVSLDITKI